jgi:hypothetical protein
MFDKALLTLIVGAEDLAADCEDEIKIGVVLNYAALCWMKQPELMYRIYNDMKVLENSSWIDEVLGLVKHYYNEDN